MYLIHITNFKNLKKILEDYFLKSSKITKKLGQGEGIYKENDFVYFSVTDRLEDNRVYNLVQHDGGVIIYLKPGLLYKKAFFSSNLHTPDPENLKEWKTKEGLLFKRKYEKNYLRINSVLRNLYKYSIKMYEPGFIAFNQIAVKNKVNLKNNLACIQILGNNEYISKISKFLDKFGNYDTNINKYYVEFLKRENNILTIMF